MQIENQQFQSLTGSIHTEIENEGKEGSKEFQSLTGSIHTKSGVIRLAL